MKDRFDLENEIVGIHNFCEYLEDLYTYVLEEKNLDIDHIANYLLSIATLLKGHANKLHDTMCQTLGLDEYKA
jgi:hypothetical protein